MHDRRSALQFFSAVAVAAGLPSTALNAQTAGRKPPRLRLRQGDTVGLVKPAGFLAEDFELQLVFEAVAAMGLVPKPAPHLLSRYGYLAGGDQARAADLNAMYADDSVRAVFAVRGGWGSARVLPYLDFDLIRANPKLLIGFSDVTALHMAFAARAGFTTIHGPNAGSAWGKLSWDWFKSLVFDGETPVYRNPLATEDRLVQRDWRTQTIRPGKAVGRLLGGNLTVLAALMGTPYLPQFDGAILFLEDIDEAEYRIDRMLTQLTLAGVLRRVAAVVFGQCTNCHASGPLVRRIYRLSGAEAASSTAWRAGLSGRAVRACRRSVQPAGRRPSRDRRHCRFNTHSRARCFVKSKHWIDRSLATDGPAGAGT